MAYPWCVVWLLSRGGLQGSKIEPDDGALIDFLAEKLPNFGEKSSNLMAGGRPALVFFGLYKLGRG